MSIIIVVVLIFGGIYFYYNSYQRYSSLMMSEEDCDFSYFETTVNYAPPVEQEWYGYDNKEETGYICHSVQMIKRKLTKIYCYRIFSKEEIDNNKDNFFRGEEYILYVRLPLYEKNYICSMADYCKVFKSAFLRKFPGSSPMYKDLDCSNYGGGE